MVVLLVSRFSRVSREEQVYRMQLHRVPEQEVNAPKLKFTRYAPLLLAVYSVTMCIILITVYVQPYQEITGAWAQGVESIG